MRLYMMPLRVALRVMAGWRSLAFLIFTSRCTIGVARTTSRVLGGGRSLARLTVLALFLASQSFGLELMPVALDILKSDIMLAKIIRTNLNDRKGNVLDSLPGFRKLGGEVSMLQNLGRRGSLGRVVLEHLRKKIKGRRR